MPISSLPDRPGRVPGKGSVSQMNPNCAAYIVKITRRPLRLNDEFLGTHERSGDGDRAGSERDLSKIT